MRGVACFVTLYMILVNRHCVIRIAGRAGDLGTAPTFTGDDDSDVSDTPESSPGPVPVLRIREISFAAVQAQTDPLNVVCRIY